MLINTRIWEATIEAAKAKSAGNDYILRAIDRASKEINKTSYWSWANGVLKIKSITSKKLYTVDAQHSCEAMQNGMVCRHKVAQRLMMRYHEALQGN